MVSTPWVSRLLVFVVGGMALACSDAGGGAADSMSGPSGGAGSDARASAGGSTGSETPGSSSTSPTNNGGQIATGGVHAGAEFGGSVSHAGDANVAGAGGQGGSVGTAGTSSGSEPTLPVGGAGSAPDCNGVMGQPIITVAADGSGTYTSVNAALQGIGKDNKTPTQIRIKPGTYRERFTLETPMVTLCGQPGKAAETVIVGSGSGTSTGFTVLITADDVSVENLTLQNTVVDTQAPALMTKSRRTQFRNCRILGFQDTLYAHSGTQYYRNCYIEGRVDYIFGGATAVYDNCEMRTVEAGTAVAAPNTVAELPFGLVFLGGKLTAVSKIAKGSQNLARSWGKVGATHYIGTQLGEHIKPTGWASMKPENKVSEARFGEYGTTGPGADPSARTSEVPPMTAADAAKFTVANIFGSWSPSYSK